MLVNVNKNINIIETLSFTNFVLFCFLFYLFFHYLGLFLFEASINLVRLLFCLRFRIREYLIIVNNSGKLTNKLWVGIRSKRHTIYPRHICCWMLMPIRATERKYSNSNGDVYLEEFRHFGKLDSQSRIRIKIY